MGYLKLEAGSAILRLCIKGGCCLGPTALLGCDNVKLHNPTAAVWGSRFPWPVYKSRLCVVVISYPPSPTTPHPPGNSCVLKNTFFLLFWIISFRVTLNITQVDVVLAQLEPPRPLLPPREGG